MKAELQRRQSNLDRVEELFRRFPGVWIAAVDFEQVGGRQAWRSRVAECRTKRDMHIENRLEKDEHGAVVASWYRFLPHGAPLGPSAESVRVEKHPPVQKELFR